MLNSNLLEALRAISRDELASFVEFVPWALRKQDTERKDAVKLLAIIKKHYPDFDHPSLQKELIYKKIFPGKPYVDLKIDKIMVTLTKCFRNHFLTLRYLEPNNEFNLLLESCQFYKEKGLPARYQQSFRQLENHFNQNKLLSIDHSYKNFQIEYEKLDWLSISNDHKTDINILNTVIALQQFTDLNLLDLLIKYAFQLKFVMLETPEFIQNKIETLLNQTTNKNNSLYQTYLEIFKIFYSAQVGHLEFEKCLNLIQHNEKIFDYETLYTLHVSLRNLCTILINQGNRELSHTLFDLQKQSIASGFHFYKGKISPSSFVSVVINALNVKEVEWTRAFIEEHKDRIIGETEERSYLNFCWANYLFANGQYTEAIDFIPQNMREISYILIARRLEIKAFYEIDLYLADVKATAFRTYVLRLPSRNFHAETVEYNFNFARFTLQLLLIPNGHTERARRLAERVAENRFVSDREWLYEQIRIKGGLSTADMNAVVQQTPIKETKLESVKEA